MIRLLSIRPGFHKPNAMNLSTTIPIENYLTRSWLRQHLYYLGFDLIRLHSYQKLSKSIGTNSGGMIKSLVSDISTFINRELGEYNSSTAASNELKDLMYCYGNDVISDFTPHNISPCRLFFMFAGYMMLNQSSAEQLDKFTDRLVSIYLSSNNFNLTNRTDAFSNKVVTLNNEYFNNCQINYDVLYNNSPKSINLFITKHIKIDLPPLPKIYNKKLLAKSLVHKELYRAFIHPDHPFNKILISNGIEPKETSQILRNDLSFFDGLGDYYLAHESSNLLYQFKNSAPYKDETSFGRKSYTLLKTILATNTLLSRLALAYNLHEGLNDPIVRRFFKDDYVPLLEQWCDSEFIATEEYKDFRYEQEYVADYFEQYVGTLFLEQPNVCQKWINKIYENILFSISNEHKVPSKVLVQYDYNSWGVDVIGRRLR